MSFIFDSLPVYYLMDTNVKHYCRPCTLDFASSVVEDLHSGRLRGYTLLIAAASNSGWKESQVKKT